LQCRKSRDKNDRPTRHVMPQVTKSVEFLQISGHQKLLKSLHFWPSYSRNNRAAFSGAHCTIRPPHLFIWPPPCTLMALALQLSWQQLVSRSFDLSPKIEQWTCSISFNLLPKRHKNRSTCCWWCGRTLTRCILPKCRVKCTARFVSQQQQQWDASIGWVSAMPLRRRYS